MGLDISCVLPYLAPVYSPDDTRPLRRVGSKDGPIARQFSSTLVVQYAIDEPGALVFVRERDVGEDEHDALHRNAIENLRRHAARRRLRFQPISGMCFARLDGQHDASLILLDELWDPPTRIADPDGEIVVAVPARNILAFAGSAAAGGVGELRSAIGARERALCPELFVRRAGSWQCFES